MKLGPGRHYGEWVGSGVQVGYGLTNGEKRFYLFNTARWSDDTVRPKCCYVVPVLWSGKFDDLDVNKIMADLKEHGSYAVPGFARVEGIVVYHTAGNVGFKKTFEKDGTGKWDK
jgi:hypothetical protein